MPKVKLGGPLPEPQKAGNLILRYIKVERKMTVDTIASKVGVSPNTHHHRMQNPEKLNLQELRAYAKALEIPWEEMSAALAAALRY